MNERSFGGGTRVRRTSFAGGRSSKTTGIGSRRRVAMQPLKRKSLTSILQQQQQQQKIQPKQTWSKQLGVITEIAEEESSLRSLVESLKVEFENVKKEHSELKEKEEETESIARNLHVKRRKSKSELEAYLAEEAKIRVYPRKPRVHKKKPKQMKNKAMELKKEAEATKNCAQRIREAAEVKVAGTRALDQIKLLSERGSAARASTS
ncbi:hypothetical protein CISIN_1g045148mg [Citrus sinensis]|uniref:Uncharacterized protein n=1 Tax=Citrus sinensis TaxID=2711 RepID=A0A067G794_CITSI|nr:hypothetical protein CISIN_1g045148mg [Citrus sinensis]